MYCLLCQQSTTSGALCGFCSESLPEAIAGCSTCGERLDANGACADCRLHQPFFTKAIAGCDYAWPADWLVQRFKFDHVNTVLKPLVNKLEDAIKRYYRESSLPDVIVPMPLHKSRLHERGYNQSKLTAIELSKLFHKPVQEYLVKIRATEHQSRLNAAQRQRNLKGSFAVTQLLQGRSCALVDDVMTTGATANEASRTLLNGGASQVHIWLLARATTPTTKF